MTSTLRGGTLKGEDFCAGSNLWEPHVYDPFLGSGTTLIAAETTGRVAFGIEIDPLYVDVAIRRWQAFTGKAATLQGDGRAFGEVSVERLAGSAEDAPGSDETHPRETLPPKSDVPRNSGDSVSPQPGKEG